MEAHLPTEKRKKEKKIKKKELWRTPPPVKPEYILNAQFGSRKNNIYLWWFAHRGKNRCTRKLCRSKNSVTRRRPSFSFCLSRELFQGRLWILYTHIFPLARRILNVFTDKNLHEYLYLWNKHFFLFSHFLLHIVSSIVFLFPILLQKYLKFINLQLLNNLISILIYL